MLTCYFGVPGCGKTSLLTKFAIDELRRMKKGKSPYKHIYTNFHCLGCEIITFDDLKKYVLYDSLIILDEITMDADNRHFKNFSDDVRNFFILHRHIGCDVIYATQNYSLVDLKIREYTQDLWYMQKSCVPFLRGFTTAKKIYRNININEHTSELVLGYRFCNFLESLFSRNFKIVWRKKYYKYFDSFDPGVLAERPEFCSSSWGVLPEPIIYKALRVLPFARLKVNEVSKGRFEPADVPVEDSVSHIS